MSARTRSVGTGAVGAFGGVVLLLGLVLAYVTRDHSSPVAAVVSLVVGNVLVLGATAATVAQERTAGALTLPAGGGPRLPSPAWWFPTAATGVLDLAAGPAASGWIGLAGAILVAAAMVGAGQAWLTQPAGPDRTVVRAARRLRAAAAPGNQALVGALEPVGRSGVRVVAVGPDGRWVDVMLSDGERARSAAGLAGVDVRDQTDPAFARAFATRPQPRSGEVQPPHQ